MLTRMWNWLKDGVSGLVDTLTWECRVDAGPEIILEDKHSVLQNFLVSFT